MSIYYCQSSRPQMLSDHIPHRHCNRLITITETVLDKLFDTACKVAGLNLTSDSVTPKPWQPPNYRISSLFIHKVLIISEPTKHNTQTEQKYSMSRFRENTAQAGLFVDH